jgi:hypothetical protein
MAAVTYFVLFFCHVHALNLMIPALVLSKIYANSLLVLFNSRVNIIRGRIRTPEVIDSLVFPKTVNDSSISQPHGNPRTDHVGTLMSAMTIEVTTSYVSQRGNVYHSVLHQRTNYVSYLQTPYTSRSERRTTSRTDRNRCGAVTTRIYLGRAAT